MKCRMSKLKINKIKNSDVSKVKFIILLLVCVTALTFSIPSLARYKNFVDLEAMFNEVQTWDGSVATSYNSGTGSEEDPYIISNASELAFFVEKLKTTNYAGTYFKLGNNIILNDGLFGYSDNNITYTLDDTVFYLDKYTNNAYDNSELTGNVISTVNLLGSIKNFNGYFDGDYRTIYGLYLTSEENELALINNLFGTFENVYFENAFVYGGSKSSVVANDVVYSELNNVSVSGTLVGTGNANLESISKHLDNLEIIKDTNSYSNTIELSSVNDVVISDIVLRGNYVNTDSEQVLTINGEAITTGDFEVSLGTDVTSLVINIEDNIESNIVLSNLVIDYKYNYPISSGVVSTATGTNLNNIISKVDVYGINSSSLIGIASDISLTNSYNNGNVNGTNVSMLIGRISNNNSSSINKVYNNGVGIGTKTNLIGSMLHSNNLIISNTFNTSSLNTTLGDVTGNVEIVNVYDVNSTSVSSGTITGTVNVVNYEDYTKEVFINNLVFNEYIDEKDREVNTDNIWVYEFKGEPILYIDDLNNPIASLNIGVHSWNDLGYELNTLEYIEGKAFNITPIDGNNGFKGVYYYIHESKDALNRSDIEALDDWIEYEDVVSLDTEGYQIVYVKIVDQEDRNYYINSDLLFFDLYGPNIKMVLGENSWTSFNASLDSLYINDKVNLTLEVNDTYADVVSTQYYVSDVVKTKEELDNITEWDTYENNITIDSKGTSIVYVKAVDSNNHVSYINSDYIIYGGYSSSLMLGENSTQLVDEVNITGKSSVTYNFTYSEDIPYTTGYSNNIVSSIKLPQGTLMTLVDNKLNKIYTYVVTSDDDNIYSLNKFSMVGTLNEVLFDDTSYLVTDSKDVSLIVDFKDAEVTGDLTFNLVLDVRDSMDNIVLSTLNDTLKNTNVYSGLNSELTISNRSVLYGINYDSDSTNIIEFEYSFNSLIKNNVVVNDTYYENKKTGIIVKLVDSEGATVDKKYLKNMEFIVGGNSYAADSDGVVRINMSSTLDKVSSSITIVTHENDLDLKDGTYSLVIVPFIASDGKYSSHYSDSKISIPVVSDYEEILDYDFNVTMSDENKILMKDTGNVEIPFEIVSNNEFDDSNIRISMYKKNKLSAYDQTYSLIDLMEYSTNEFDKVSDSIYKVEGNGIKLKLDLSSLDKTGYEIRFELYDGDKKIDTIKKKIIVR